MTNTSSPLLLSELPLSDSHQVAAALLRAGITPANDLEGVEIISSNLRPRSQTVRLGLTYRHPTTEAPQTLLLKFGPADTSRTELPNHGPQEVYFYSNIASAMHAQLVPRCFDHSWEPATHAWHLLLEDLTDSHVLPTVWPLPPKEDQCRAILLARARFHAEWWDDPRLGLSIGTWRDSTAMDHYVAAFASAYARFADAYPELLPSDRRQLYERFIAYAPRLLDRYHSRRNLTITQGDAHVWNCFVPHDNDPGGVRFFDWEDWNIMVGAADLAYMMVLYWYPERRRRLERSLLDFYHDALLSHGVTTFPRNALEEDYRLAALWQITTPVLQSSYQDPRVWWNNFERIFMAVDDLDCRALLS